MTDTEKGLREQPAADAPSGGGKRRKVIIALGVVACCLALIIGLSVGLTRDNSNNNSNQSASGDETTVDPPTNTKDPPASTTKFQSSVGRAFDISLNLLTPNVLQGYDGDEEALRADLVQAVQMYVSNSIEEQIRWGSHDGGAFPQDESFADGLPDGDAGNAEGGVAGDMESSPMVGDTTTDFETNNQEEGVDEADRVKSDGTYVYAVYGDTLLVWDASSGDAITNYTLPKLQKTENPGIRDEFDIGDIDIGMEDSMFYGDAGGASIAGLSLHANSNKLVLFVSGYGYEVMKETGTKSSCPGLSTRVIVMDTSLLPQGDLVPLTQQDVLGEYRDARMIGEIIHVVTNCNFHFYTLDQVVYRWNFPEGLNDTEYRAAAAAAVQPNITDYVDLMISDITTHGFPNMPQISLWQSSLGGNEATVEAAFNQGPVSAFTSLLSFNVASIDEGDTLQLSNAGACTPSAWGFTYAVDGMLVYAAQGWNWNEEKQASVQTTYLMGYSLDGTIAQPALLGSFPGYMQSQYALSIHEGHLRVATTIESFFPANWDDVIDVDTVELWPQPQFETQNQVIILKIPEDDGDELTEVASIEDLGEAGETIQAVRYFGDIGYAVTYRQTDPFYVLSLDPNDAKVLGELKITGFSSYLHSMNDANTLLVGFGLEAYENGTVVGLQLTIYDASTPSTPVDIHRQTIENELNVWSSSAATSDYKAFRYLSLGDEVGLAILPVTIQSASQTLAGNFDGFFVYDVSRAGINLRMNISHVDSENFFGGCYSNSDLPQRSLVFNGDVTTLKGHSVVSTDLDAGNQEWNFTLPNSNSNMCYMW